MGSLTRFAHASGASGSASTPARTSGVSSGGFPRARCRDRLTPVPSRPPLLRAHDIIYCPILCRYRSFACLPSTNQRVATDVGEMGSGVSFVAEIKANAPIASGATVLGSRLNDALDPSPSRRNLCSLIAESKHEQPCHGLGISRAVFECERTECPMFTAFTNLVKSAAHADTANGDSSSAGK